MAKDFLFLYGSLRKGGAMHGKLIAPHCSFEGNGELPGRLFGLGDYPGLLPATGSGGRVKGEVWRFDSSFPLLARLDEYEGCAPASPRPHEFRREKKGVLLDDGRRLKAWVWYFNRRANPLARIESGDWFAR